MESSLTVCVFCGGPPVARSREHVLPQWLIRLTGDPNRTVGLGRNWSHPQLQERRFALSRFTFPACGECNQQFSSLEAAAKQVMSKLQELAPLTDLDWDTFLDWLDKVRTGLWLGQRMLNRNHAGITPLFHIQQRVARKDRFVIVYRLQPDDCTGLSWIGTDDPIFHRQPSVFGLGANRLLFLSVSFDFLFSRRFGFPYALQRRARPGGGELVDLEDGTEKTILPLVEYRFKSGGTQLWQPIVPWQPNSNAADLEAMRRAYDTDFVRRNCLDFDRGKGRLFRRNRNELVVYPSEPSTSWIPRTTVPVEEAVHDVAVMVSDLLGKLFENHARLDDLPAEFRLAIESEIASTMRLHLIMRRHLLAQRPRRR